MIRINDVEYECKSCECKKVGTVENLHIIIEGELKDTRLHIDFEGKSYFGHKVVMTRKDTESDILVYIFQEGDSEL